MGRAPRTRQSQRCPHWSEKYCDVDEVDPWELADVEIMRVEGDWIFDLYEEDVVHGYCCGQPEGSQGDRFASGL